MSTSPWVVPTEAASVRTDKFVSPSYPQQQLHRSGLAGVPSSTPPALYDTSVSSTTNDDSMTESARSTTPQRLLSATRPVSEPGHAQDNDRFVAYVNRFAQFDPRMDYRAEPSSSLTSAALQAAARSHAGRGTTHSEARLSQILRKHAGVAAATRRSSNSGGGERNRSAQRIRQGLERFTSNTSSSTSTPQVRRRPAISSPQQSLLRAVTDLRAGKQPQRSRSAATRHRHPTPPPTTARSHHFVSPPTSPDTSRSRSAPRTQQYHRELQTPVRRRLSRPTTPASPRAENNLLPFTIQQVDERAAIEIPSPTKVRDLRAHLWNRKEQLRTTKAVSSSQPAPIFPQRFVQAAERNLTETTTRATPAVVVSPTTTVEAEDSDDSDDDCDSTVSSITNPTYQDTATTAKQHVWQQHKQRQQLAATTTTTSPPKPFAELRRELQRTDSDSGILMTDSPVGKQGAMDDSGIVTQDTPTLLATTTRAAPDDLSTGIITASTPPPQQQQEQRRNLQQHPWDQETKRGKETTKALTGAAARRRIQRQWDSQPIVEESQPPTVGDTTTVAAAAAAGTHNPQTKAVEACTTTTAAPLEEERCPQQANKAIAVPLEQQPLEDEEERCPSARLDQATADALANEFDSAWVNIPASKYFGGSRSRSSTTERQQYQKTKKRSSRSSSRGSSRASSRSHTRREEDEVTDSNNLKMGYVPVDLEQDDARFGGNRQKQDTARGVQKPSSSSSFEPYSNLHAHLHRQQQRQGQSSDDARTSHSAGHRTHTSTVSRRSFPEVRGGGDNRRRLLVTDHGFRSRSADRMRNPQTAKKYSRMLRVYNEETGSGGGGLQR